MQLCCHLGNGEMAEHSLDVNDEGCNPILHNDPSTLHIHGPSCGHERVLHGTHYDYLVRVLGATTHGTKERHLSQ